jgi:hypothetical protein
MPAAVRSISRTGLSERRTASAPIQPPTTAMRQPLTISTVRSWELAASRVSMGRATETEPVPLERGRATTRQREEPSRDETVKGSPRASSTSSRVRGRIAGAERGSPLAVEDQGRCCEPSALTKRTK